MVTVGPYQAVSFNWKGIISEMPPVEGNSFVDASVLPPVMELKVVDKAMQLPVVSDAVSEVSKYAHNIRCGSLKHVIKSDGLVRFYKRWSCAHLQKI